VQPSVLVRRASRNSAPAVTTTRAPFVLIASRIISADRLEILLRGEHVGTLDGVRRHAHALLRATSERTGAACCVDVVDFEGSPVFSCASTAGGAS
jgi:hypothetical protein